MKGLEYKMILALIIMIVLILFAVLIVISPGGDLAGQSKDDINFREACFYWSFRSYRGKYYVLEEEEKGMESHCANALNKLSVTTEEEWEQCRDICRGTV